MRPKFYHCAPIPLSNGSVIEPGNWGRIIRTYEVTNGQIASNAIREALFETVRVRVAELKPSRLACVFCCPTMEAAISYRDSYATTNLVYGVEPTDDRFRQHIGDYKLAVEPYEGRYFDRMIGVCEEYWQDGPVTHPEILISCSVKVVERVA